jgi:hypothetical protein
MRDQISHLYRTTCKILALYILIFTFFDSRRGARRQNEHYSTRYRCNDSAIVTDI